MSEKFGEELISTYYGKKRNALIIQRIMMVLFCFVKFFNAVTLLNSFGINSNSC